jgi:ubiquinone/menaquinone biosynthesis C-methylase UbiE
MANDENPVLLCWNENAKYWIQYSDTIRAMFAPLTAAMIEHAKIEEGQTVLDVAGGSGEPGLTIAEKVGPRGSVTCTDAVAEMVEAARHDATRRGLANVQFRQCTADSLPFPDNSFDATVCRLGIMFVPDPVVAVREMLRVTKPGGKLALAVWHKSEVNPFCYVVTNVMAQHVDSPAADPEAPNAFRFAETGKLANVLTEAGAHEVEERVVKFNIQAAISAQQFWTMRSQTSDTLREKLANLSHAEQAQIAAEVEQEVKEFFPHDQMNFPTQMILVTGTKPAADLHK